MPTLLTTTIPDEYIGEAAVVLFIGLHRFDIQLRFTVFGELLQYDCPALELPKAALKLSYNAKIYTIIIAEIDYLPFRLLQMAFGKQKKYAPSNPWKPVMEKLREMKKGKNLLTLNLKPEHPIVKEFIENGLLSEQRENILSIYYRIYAYTIGNEQYRIEHINGLGNKNNPIAFELILRAVADSNEKISNRAIQILGYWGDIRATQVLLEVLQSSHQEKCIEAAKSLGILNNPESVEPLLSLLHHPSPEVNGYAALALFNLGDDRAVQPMISLLSHPSSPIFSVAFNLIDYKSDMRFVEPMIAVLENNEFRERHHYLAGYLGRLGDSRAVPALIACINEPSLQLRLNAIYSLGIIGDSRSINPLVIALNDPEKQVALRAANALAKLGDDRVIEPLIAALNENREIDCSKAAESLGNLGDIRAVEPLIAALKHPFVSTRLKAIEALGSIKDVRAIPHFIRLIEERQDTSMVFSAKKSMINIGKPAIEPLLKALKHENGEVRRAYADILYSLGDICTVEQLLNVMNDSHFMVCYHLVNAVSKHGEHAILPLISVMMNPKHKAKAYAAAALGYLKDDRAVEPLIEVLKDKDKDVRQFAAQSLGIIADNKAFEPLLGLLKDDNFEVRRRTVSALGHLGDKRAIPYLLKALKSKDKILCRRAIQAFESIGDTNVADFLVPYLKDKNNLVFQQAALTLGRFKDARALKNLIIMVKYNYLFEEHAVPVLSEMGEVAVPTLIEELNSSYYQMRIHAAQILGKTGDKRAIPHLEKRLETETITSCRKAMLEALEKLTANKGKVQSRS